ncbi:MAG: hypothetical protein HC802_11235 [Caldilineaceae bacterium]|nr:hypothetical protein [Caldilineaceae bacterium]
MTAKLFPELQNYLQRLENLRDQIGALLVDLPAEALNWLPVEATMPTN